MPDGPTCLHVTELLYNGTLQNFRSIPLHTHIVGHSHVAQKVAGAAGLENSSSTRSEVAQWLEKMSSHQHRSLSVAQNHLDKRKWHPLAR